MARKGQRTVFDLEDVYSYQVLGVCLKRKMLSWESIVVDVL
ncbi:MULTISPECIES: hypothetical protein [unclassified Lysinibacillus]|nr:MULTISPECIES: hypothetical protein [unclassified Lysinibacillus]